jgi:hypothetical protein
VIRFNGGITKGFEQHVGSKTTVRLANTQHLGVFESEVGLARFTHVHFAQSSNTFKS